MKIELFMDIESPLKRRVTELLDQSGISYQFIDWRCPPIAVIYNGQSQPEEVKGVRNIRKALENLS